MVSTLSVNLNVWVILTERTFGWSSADCHFASCGDTFSSPGYGSWLDVHPSCTSYPMKALKRSKCVVEMKVWEWQKLMVLSYRVHVYCKKFLQSSEILSVHLLSMKALPNVSTSCFSFSCSSIMLSIMSRLFVPSSLSVLILDLLCYYRLQHPLKYTCHLVFPCSDAMYVIVVHPSFRRKSFYLPHCLVPAQSKHVNNGLHH